MDLPRITYPLDELPILHGDVVVGYMVVTGEAEIEGDYDGSISAIDAIRLKRQDLDRWVDLPKNSDLFRDIARTIERRCAYHVADLLAEQMSRRRDPNAAHRIGAFETLGRR